MKILGKLKIVKNREVVYESEMKSFVKNFTLFLMSKIGNRAVTVVDVDGVEHEINFGYLRLRQPARYWQSYEVLIFEQCDAPENDDTFGILVGSGTTPVSPNDYRLENPYTSDVVAYSSCMVSQVTVSDNTMKFTFARPIINTSQDSITINETGIVMWVRRYIRDSYGVRLDVNFKMLIARDVLQNPVTLNPLEGAEVIYTFQITT